MRTFIYIDGFNLYYNTFRGERNKDNRGFKWLDLESFTSSILFKKYKKNEIVKTKYYTAHISGAQDMGQVHRQNAYLRGLELHSNGLEIVYGKFLIQEGYRPLVGSEENETVKVFLPEEKGSDVNLATHLVYEATQDQYDVAVVLTNDTDMSEAFKIVSTNLDKTIILIQAEHVKTAKSLKRHSFDVLKYDTSDLEKNQLPDQIGSKITRPKEWSL
jgi:uncharacterized LabA/DUF88 family protein